MKVKTSIKAGGISVNRCETITDADADRFPQTVDVPVSRRPRRNWAPTLA